MKQAQIVILILSLLGIVFTAIAFIESIWIDSYIIAILSIIGNGSALGIGIIALILIKEAK